LLNKSQKQGLLSEIANIEDKDILNSIIFWLEKEDEFTIKFLKNILCDYKEMSVYELKTKLNHWYVQFIKNKELNERIIDFKDSDLILELMA
jgi:hypothetical protein